MSNYYPTVEPGSLIPVEMIINGMHNDPLWLERKSCPYDPGTKAEIQALWALARPAGGILSKSLEDATDEASPLSDTDLEKHLAGLHRMLQQQAPTVVGEGGDMGYFRVAVSLADKIIGLRERVTNVKAVSDYQSKVVRVFEEVMQPEQRTRAIALLEGKDE